MSRIESDGKMKNKIKQIFRARLTSKQLEFVFNYYWITLLILTIAIVYFAFQGLVEISSFFSILIIILIGMMTVIHQAHLFEEQREREVERIKETQLGILKSLNLELETLSSKKRTIEILDSKFDLKGNLQWVEECIKKDTYPAHSIFRLSAERYLELLQAEIESKKTSELKKALVFINQKIELIENWLRERKETRHDKEMELSDRDAQIKRYNNAILGVISEMKPLIKNLRTYISKNWF